MSTRRGKAKAKTCQLNKQLMAAEEAAKIEAQRRATEEQEKAAEEAVAANIDALKAAVKPKQELREWVSFSAYMTYEEAFELKKWMQDRGIEIKKHKED